MSSIEKKQEEKEKRKKTGIKRKKKQEENKHVNYFFFYSFLLIFSFSHIGTLSPVVKEMDISKFCGLFRVKNKRKKRNQC